MTKMLHDMGMVVFSDVILPILVSVIMFRIQYGITIRDEKKKIFPEMFVLNLDGKEKVCLNKEKIKGGGRIVEFRYKGYLPLDNGIAQTPRKSIEFKEITYDKLVKECEKQEMFFMGFENFTKNSMCLTHILDENGRFNEIDEDVVPIFMTDETRYCFVCRKQDMPLELRGKIERKSLTYKINGLEKGVIFPQIN